MTTQLDASKADLVITPSHRSADDLEKIGGVPKSKLKVLGLGVAPAPDDPARLVAPLKAALTSGATPVEFGGRRGGPLAVFRRLRRNAQEKQKP